MTKLDAAIERLRALPIAAQESLADEIEGLIAEATAPTPPSETGGSYGDDAELRRRIDAWRTHKRAVSAVEIHSGLRRRHSAE